MGFLVVLTLLLLGLVVGGSIERNHFRDLEQREHASRHRVVLSDKHCDDPRPVARASLAVGSVVISTDYFKQFLAAWRLLFGGELRGHATLLERARREALQRMKESAPHADLFLNVRFETFMISQNSQNALGTVELFAYGTAIRFVRRLDDDLDVPSPHDARR
ncbi:MAG: YbjQ family protein [Myxococcales bacterium]|jgi:uncharacterized protein YbjQ (UPF0145 family)|nr:YbjQ family protein [Myxococcales bacterium]